MREVVVFALSAGIGLGVAACGQPSPEERIRDATEQVHRAEAELEAARQSAERAEGELERSREELERARQTVRDAEARLAEANEHVALVADDAYLFRAVQSALLADPALEDLAIAARVRDGVVTLTGRVDQAAERDRAGEIAEGVPGVEQVNNQVAVELAVQ